MSETVLLSSFVEIVIYLIQDEQKAQKSFYFIWNRNLLLPYTFLLSLFSLSLSLSLSLSIQLNSN